MGWKLIYKHFCHCQTGLLAKSRFQVVGGGDLGSFLQQASAQSPCKGRGYEWGRGQGQLQLIHKSRALGKSPAALSGPAFVISEEGGGLDDR